MKFRALTPLWVKEVSLNGFLSLLTYIYLVITFDHLFGDAIVPQHSIRLCHIMCSDIILLGFVANQKSYEYKSEASMIYSLIVDRLWNIKKNQWCFSPLCDKIYLINIFLKFNSGFWFCLTVYLWLLPDLIRLFLLQFYQNSGFSLIGEIKNLMLVWFFRLDMNVDGFLRTKNNVMFANIPSTL